MKRNRGRHEVQKLSQKGKGAAFVRLCLAFGFGTAAVLSVPSADPGCLGSVPTLRTVSGWFLKKWSKRLGDRRGWGRSPSRTPLIALSCPFSKCPKPAKFDGRRTSRKRGRF